MLDNFSEDEIDEVCSIIPFSFLKTVFLKQSNRELHKQIFKGCRPHIVPYTNAKKLLSKNEIFRTTLLKIYEKYLLSEITTIIKKVEKLKSEGNLDDQSYAAVLYETPFKDYPHIFFKLNEHERSNEIKLILSTFKKIKDTNIQTIDNKDKSSVSSENDNSEELNNKLKVIQSLLDKLINSTHIKKDLDLIYVSKDDCVKQKEQYEQIHKSINDYSSKFNNIIINISNLMNILKKLSKNFTNFSHKQKEYLEQIKKISNITDNLKIKFSQQHNNNEYIMQMLQKISDNTSKNNQVLNLINTKNIPLPKRPKEIEIFKKKLEIYLDSIGIKSDYLDLLSDYMSHVLFQGLPILINRQTGLVLINIIATVLGHSDSVMTVSYCEPFSLFELDELISKQSRFIALDNFIGNYNETNMLSLFDRHKDKIIFLTYAFEKTLKYVSSEFLKYCYYINLNYCGLINFNYILKEEKKSTKILDEEFFVPESPIKQDTIVKNSFQDILKEFGFVHSVVEMKTRYIVNIKDLAGMLAFDIVPYCKDVLEKFPINISERYQKCIIQLGDFGKLDVFK
jgi:hypothetical protein